MNAVTPALVNFDYPVGPGQEFCGVVAGWCAKVRSFHEGDRVVSETAAVIDDLSPSTVEAMLKP